MAAKVEETVRRRLTDEEIELAAQLLATQDADSAPWSALNTAYWAQEVSAADIAKLWDRVKDLRGVDQRASGGGDE